MKLTYDPSANVAYILLRERQGNVDTFGILVDTLIEIDNTPVFLVR